MSDKVIIVGESNPYGADPYYALYPAPDGCSGHRLCCKILRMHRKEYLELFDRVNLCEGKWSAKLARKKAEEIACADGGARLILLGSKVCSAFLTNFRPFTISGMNNRVILPHPSGLCRLWNIDGAFERAREIVLKMAPELREKVGVA